MSDETLLSLDKQVHRHGNTVTRPMGSHTPHVHALLNHLSRKGLNVPQVLPADEQGRDVLSYIEGEQVHPNKWTDEGLAAVGRMVAQLHCAAQDFIPDPSATWNSWCLRELGKPNCFSHGDIAPWNVITDHNLPIALIDWEFAGPIDPMVELARVCWLFPQLCDDEIGMLYDLPDPAHRARQVRLILDAYGVKEAHRAGFVDRILEVVICETAHEAIDTNVTQDEIGPLWGFAWRTRSLWWIWRHRDLLRQALA